MEDKILFIRTTEKCNAKCFMCNYSGSNTGYSLSVEDMSKLIEDIKKSNFKLIRFTGGEPLLNNNLKDFIKMLKSENFKTSIITNGFLLPKKIDELVSSGLDQLIVSIDGMNSKLNDQLRGVPGIFNNAIEGIKICKSKYRNLIIRINTVVSDKNIDTLCDMNDFLLSLGIDEWSLTPLKENYNCYKGNEEKYITKYREFIKYVENHKTPRLLGYSKYWGGRTEKEIHDLFFKNIHYTPNTMCELVKHVAFYIPSKKLLLPCNSLAHRLEEVETFIGNEMDMFDKCDRMANWLQKCGQKNCKGCSPINVYLAENPDILKNDIWGF